MDENKAALLEVSFLCPVTQNIETVRGGKKTFVTKIGRDITGYIAELFVMCPQCGILHRLELV